MQKNSTLLEGPMAENPSDIVPFLYFYNSLSIVICPGCPMARKPSTLKSFLEKGLISVFLADRFSQMPKKLQKLAYEYPELFVGPSSYFAYRNAMLANVTGQTPHDNHFLFCPDCQNKQLNPYFRYLRKLKKLDRIRMVMTGNKIIANPLPSTAELSELFINTAKKHTSNSIRELSTTVSLVNQLASAQYLGVVPQIEKIFFQSATLFLEPLRIIHNRNANLEQYLELVRSFKGKLSPTIVSSNHSAILNKVTKINEEVNKIQSSNRLPLEVFLSKFVTAIPSLLTRIVSNGSYGLEGVYDAPPTGFKSQRLSEIKTKILSKYFGVSEAGIQVWQIRDKLDKIKRK